MTCLGQLVSAQFLPSGICRLQGSLETTVRIPHPTDCSSFYSCSNGVPKEQHCPAGLHFNEELKVCDWPENANCVKRKLS
jgi:hypothetical protein